MKKQKGSCNPKPGTQCQIVRSWPHAAFGLRAARSRGGRRSFSSRADAHQDERRWGRQERAGPRRAAAGTRKPCRGGQRWRRGDRALLPRTPTSRKPDTRAQAPCDLRRDEEEKALSKTYREQEGEPTERIVGDPGPFSHCHCRKPFHSTKLRVYSTKTTSIAAGTTFCNA